MTAVLVDTPAALADLVRRLEGAAVLYLDTEFVRTRTYFARPGLVQLGAGGDTVHLVDPVALADLRPLAGPLASPGIVKVVHSGQEDVGLVQALCGVVPAPLYDTQVAAAFCGHGIAAGYGTLVREVLGHDVPKGQTRSDWRQRPLTAAQLGYAQSDVAHLAALHEHLLHAVQRRGMSAWVAEDLGGLADPARYRSDPESAYLRIREAARLDRRGLGALRALAAWREREAMARDLPRARVATDHTLVALAEQRPASAGVLARVEGLSPGLRRRHGATLLRLVAAADRTAARSLPLPLRPPVAWKPLLDALRARVDAVARHHRLPPELIASRRELEAAVAALAHGADLAGRLARGWRAEALGPDLPDLVAAHRPPE